MHLVQSPIVWLRRFRNRKGYGVHSPWAFQFITGVIYEREAYYAYTELDVGLAWCERLRYRSVLHLLFRLGNFWEQGEARLVGGDERMRRALCAARRRGDGASCLNEGVLCGAAAQDVADGRLVMTVVCDIDRGEGREEWLRLLQSDDSSVTFDLYDIGIAFSHLPLPRQDYKVNW